MLEHKFYPTAKLLQVSLDLPQKYVESIAAELHDTGYSVIDVRHKQNAQSIIFIECAEKDVNKIVELIKIAAE